MALQVYKYKTQHAWGESDWTFTLLSESKRLPSGKTLRESIYSNWEHSDKYRGCIIRKVQPKDIPEKWLESQKTRILDKVQDLKSTLNDICDLETQRKDALCSKKRSL